MGREADLAYIPIDPARDLDDHLGAMPKNVVIGVLGSTLDRGGPDRWSRWRPSVDLCRHEDLLVRRFELLSQTQLRRLADEVMADIRTASPETEVRLHELPL